MADAAGLPSRLFSELIARPSRDDYWREYDFRYVLAEVDVPVLLWSGWYDTMLTATLGCWRGMEEADAEAGAEGTARRPRRLTLGPTDHETSPDFTGTVGRIRLPEEPTVLGPRARVHGRGAAGRRRRRPRPRRVRRCRRE